MKRLLYLSIFIFIVSFASANTKNSVTIYGNSPEYANIHLQIKYIQNYITRNLAGIETFKVEKDGDFRVTFEVAEITKIYIPLGETLGFLYVNPGHSYEIQLPPYKPLKPENKLNPYFTPEHILLGYLNNPKDSVNKQVVDFNSTYNSLFAEHIKRILVTNNKGLANKIIKDLEEEFPSDNNDWFNNYKDYSYISLKDFIYANKKRQLIEIYFSNKPIQYNLDPYWDAFNQIFSNFFLYYFKNQEGKNLLANWSSPTCSFDSLCTTLTADTLFKNRELSELVIMKSLYDGYYSDRYDKDKIISLFTEAIEQCKSDYCKNIAAQIQSKISKLRVGTKAPEFSVPTLSGKQKELKDFEGKFIYLNFASTDNYACKKDFQLLNELSELFQKDMRIVTILTDDDPDKAMDYINANKFKWDFLHFNQNAKILSDYNVKAFPSYILIDPEGNIVMSPAPAPEENFAPVFSEKFNEYRYQKLRKDKPKTRTIYDL